MDPYPYNTYNNRQTYSHPNDIIHNNNNYNDIHTDCHPNNNHNNNHNNNDTTKSDYYQLNNNTDNYLASNIDNNNLLHNIPQDTSHQYTSQNNHNHTHNIILDNMPRNINKRLPRSKTNPKNKSTRNVNFNINEGTNIHAHIASDPNTHSANTTTLNARHKRPQKPTKTKRRIGIHHGGSSNYNSSNGSSRIIPKSMKNTSVHGTSFPAFFQKNFSADAPNVTTNSGSVGAHDESRLRTTHRSFYPAAKRMIIIGDIHGDLDALIECLKIGRCIDIPSGVELPADPNKRTSQIIYNFVNKIKWIGGATYIIQLGDQIDRIRPTDWDDNQVAKGSALWDEGSSIHIFYLLWHLNYLANSAGGRVISIMGNHEFMNMDGDFRYVSPGEYKEYHDAFRLFYKTRPPEYLAEANAQILTEINKLQSTHPVPNGYLERRLSYAPGGIMSNFMALHYKVLLQVGSWVFCHAGLTRKTAMSGSIAVINNAISRCLLGPRVAKPSDKRIYEQIVNCRGDDSPIWTREYGNANLCKNTTENHSRICSLDALFNDYNKTNQRYLEQYNIPKASRMAVGHTPQSVKLGGINAGLDGRVWRCDVGMSRAFGEGANNRLQVLEVLDDGLEVNILQNS